MKIRVWVKTVRHSEIMEKVFDLDETDGPLTDEEINELVEDVRNQMIEWSWERVED